MVIIQFLELIGDIAILTPTSVFTAAFHNELDDHSAILADYNGNDLCTSGLSFRPVTPEFIKLKCKLLD